MDYLLWGYVAFASLFAVLYLPKLVQFLYAFKKIPEKKAAEKRRIALVVPARGESKVIGDLFASIRAQDYDRGFFDVNVIVKEADDPTVAIAEKEGARVFVVEEQTCKGDALDGFFKALGGAELENYAAFAIVDADAVLAPDFVSRLNDALEHKRDIFVVKKLLKNALGGKEANSVFADCSALSYPMVDDLSNRYRTLKNLPVNLCGQGLMVRKEVIKEVGGWPYRSLTEDLELKMDAVLRGFTAMYYPAAALYTEEPLRHSENHRRRVRWLTGHAQCEKRYLGKIREQAKREKRGFAFNYDMFFSLVPLIGFLVTTIVVALLGGALAVWLFSRGDGRWLRAFLLLFVMPLGITYGLELIHCAYSAFVYREAFKGRNPLRMAALVLFAPIYMFEYFPIFIESRFRLMRGKDTEWKPIERVDYEESLGIK